MRQTRIDLTDQEWKDLRKAAVEADMPLHKFLARLVRAAMIATMIAALCTASATAGTSTLNSIASSVAGRPVSIHCVKSFPDGRAGQASYNADLTGPGDYATIVTSLCSRIRELVRAGHFALTTGYWQTAALGVLVHEATHLAGGPMWLDETDVQCRSFRELPRVIASLGLTGFKRAWLARWHQAFPSEYTLRSC